MGQWIIVLLWISTSLVDPQHACLMLKTGIISEADCSISTNAKNGCGYGVLWEMNMAALPTPLPVACNSM